MTLNDVGYVLWLPTEYHVEEGITQYDIDFIFENPCDYLEKSGDYDWQSIKYCRDFYEQEWLQKLKEIPRTIPRHKRGIFGDMALVATGAFVGYLITNFATTHCVGSKGATGARMIINESQIKTEFNKESNMNQRWQNDVNEAITNITQALTQLDMRVSKLEKNSFMKTLNVHLLAGKIEAMSHLLSRIRSC